MKITSKNLKVIKTCNLYALYFVLGMSLIINGPTLIDLMHLIQTDIKDIAYIFPARFIGMIIGSTTGGIFFDIMTKKQLLFMIYSLMLSIATFGVPFSRSLATLLIWITLQGISMGSILAGGNVFCLQLWGKKNGPFVQALYFMSSVGSLVGPLLATPFLGNYGDIKIDKNNTISMNQTYITNGTVFRFQDLNFILTTIPAVTFVYIILAGLAFIVTILHFVTCIIAPENETKQKSKIHTNESGKVGIKYFLVLLIFILNFNLYGNQTGYSQMIVIYALKVPLQLSNIIGSYMVSVFFAALTVSRLFAIFLTTKINSMALVIANIVIVFVGSILLLFFSAYYEWALWLSTILLGAGLAPLIPACLSLVEKYITITHKIGAVLLFSSCVSANSVPFFISYYIEEKPYFFAYTIALNSACIIAVVIILFVSLKNLPNKYKIEEKIVSLNYNSDDNSL